MPESRRRALVAAVVGVVGASVGIAGAGHFYLQEWRRGLAWFTVVLGTGIGLLAVFTDPTALTMATIGTLPTAVAAPLFVLLFLSTFDAYYLAVRDTDRRDVLRCPACGGDLDPQMTFCPWCATEFERRPVSPEEVDANPVRETE